MAKSSKKAKRAKKTKPVQKAEQATKEAPRAYKYHGDLGGTDYDIPAFSYKSALIIFVSIILAVSIVPQVCGLFHVDFRLPTVIIGGLVSGFSVSAVQNFVEKYEGFTKRFWVVGILLSIFSAGIIAALLFFGIQM